MKREHKKSLNDWKRVISTDVISSVDISLVCEYSLSEKLTNDLVDNGCITKDIQLFTNLQKLTLKHLCINSPIGIQQLKLKYLDISNNELTTLLGLDSITTLTFLDASNNLITTLPSLPQLHSLNLNNNPLNDTKHIFHSLKTMTTLTSLSLPPSNINTTNISADRLREILKDTKNQIQYKNTELLQAKQAYFFKLLKSTNPVLLHCDVFIKLLILFLNQIKFFNSLSINSAVKMDINDSILQNYSFRPKQQLLQSIQNRSCGKYYSNYYNTSSKLCNFTDGQFIKKYQTITNPSIFEYDPHTPGRMVVGTKQGELYLTENNSNSINKLDTPTDSDVHGLTWGRTSNTSNIIITGHSNGDLFLYDINKENTPQANTTTYTNILSLHCNVDSTLFCTSGNENNINLYDFEQFKLWRVIGGVHKQIIKKCRFANQTPALFTSCSKDELAAVWDIRTPCYEPVLKYKAQTPLFSTQFNHTDESILISGEDNYVDTIDLRTNKSVIMKFERSWESKTISRAIHCNDDDCIVMINSSCGFIRMANRFDGKELMIVILILTLMVILLILDSCQLKMTHLMT